MTEKQSRGECAFCGRSMTRSGISTHLQTCEKRLAAIEYANQGKGSAAFLYHLQVQNAHINDFWLHLEISGRATLEDLDFYLRSIWLECCGHMSSFTIGGWSGQELSMSAKVGQALRQGMEVEQIYDFGSSTHTLIKVQHVRQGKPLTTKPIYLMSRNVAPEYNCIECGAPAKWLCIECLYELDELGYLCDEHAQAHPHDNYGDPMELFNSPRSGVCGYDGPAEPPY